MYLSEITERDIIIIQQACHDVAPEYRPDMSLSLRVTRLAQKLTETPSMYQFSSEELDVLCMALNDSLYDLEICCKDLDADDKRECMTTISELQRILRILQLN